MEYNTVALADHPELSKTLPAYDLHGGEIVLHTNRLRRLATIGCLDYDVQFTVKSGESSSYDTAIVGRDGNTALGGASGVRQAKLSEHSMDRTGPSGLGHSVVEKFMEILLTNTHSGNRPSSTIAINNNAVRERAQESGNVRSAKNWAKHINSAVTSGVLGATREHMLKRPPLGEALGGGGLGSFTISAVASHYAEGNLPLGVLPATIEGLVYTSVISQVITASEIFTTDTKLHHKCWSLIPVFHADRYAIAYGMAKAFPLVGVQEVSAT